MNDRSEEDHAQTRDGVSRGSSNPPANVNRVGEGSEFDDLLREALSWQVERAGLGEPFSISQVFTSFPQLSGIRDAELSLAYQQVLLSDQPKHARKAVEDAYPHLAEDLDRQISFAAALTVCAPETRISCSGDSHSDDTNRDGKKAEKQPLVVPGQVGRFSIEGLVGHGGMGVVFKGFDAVLQRHVAIKIPRPANSSDQLLEERLVREARIAAQLRHENLAELFEVGEFEGRSYLVSRWAGGGSLHQFLTERQSAVPETDALQLMHGMVSGLAHCHGRNVTHLDLKPGNILFGLTELAEHPDFVETCFPGVPLITDFGVAKVLDPTLTVSCTQTGVGTPMYMAPEQIERDQNNVGPASDIFASGLILYELLLGAHPLANEPLVIALKRLRSASFPPVSKLQGVSQQVQRIVQRCLQPSPKDRYASAAELLEDIERAQRGEPVQGSTWSWWPRLRAWCRREESMDQAAYVSLGLNVSLLLGFTLMLLTVSVGASAVFKGSSYQMAQDVAGLILFPHGPMSVISLAILRGRKDFHVLNTIFAALLVVMVAYSLYSGTSPFSIYDGQPFAHFLMHISVLALGVGMFVAHLLALPAWYQYFRRSGL